MAWDFRSGRTAAVTAVALVALGGCGSTASSQEAAGGVTTALSEIRPLLPLSDRVDVPARISSPRQDDWMSMLAGEDADEVRYWLGRNEFEHVSSVGGDTAGFGDRQDIWERDGTLIRVTRDRGQWWYDMSRAGTGSWLDVDTVAGAMGYKLTAPVERVAYVAASIDDRVFGALLTAERHSQ